MMKEKIKRLPILDINPTGNTAMCFYPIQPYLIDEDDHISFPSQSFRNIVAFYYQMRITKDKSRYIYPAGNTAVVFQLDENDPKSWLVGTPTSARKAEYVNSNGDYFAALFWIGKGYCLFPNPPTAIIDCHIPLNEIFPGISERLSEEMALAKSFKSRVHLFERFLSEIIIDSREIPKRHSSIINMIHHMPDFLSDYNFNKLRKTEFSSRHIHRLCIKYLGISPNLSRRIYRYQKALRFLNSNPSNCMAGVAAEQGYFDQSHFIKEFKRFQGETPTKFIRKFITQ